MFHKNSLTPACLLLMTLVAGVELPTITDGFIGKAPDVGAYESGLPVPHYGPR